MAPKNKKAPTLADNREHYRKIVTVDTCIQCRQQCLRGLDYIDKMSKAGSIGHGVPCILTKGAQNQDKKR